MNTPFELRLRVGEIINAPDELPSLGEFFPVRVTLSHTVKDVLQLLWYRTNHDWGFPLKPEYLQLVSKNGEPFAADVSFGDAFDMEEPVLVVDDVVLNINFTTTQTNRRDPVEEMFDVNIEWEDSSGLDITVHSLLIRESLECSAADLKDYIASERNRGISDHELLVDGSYFNLRYWEQDGVITDDNMKLRDILRLDVTPKVPALFELLYNFDALDRHVGTAPSVGDYSMLPTTRFFIKLSSDVPSLQHEAQLFEVNSRTTLRDFINQIIDRADRLHVRRTFFDQVKLSYNGELVCKRELFDVSLYQLMELTPDSLSESRNIFNMELSIHNHLSGVEGGILSRQFWNDLTSERFEFLPTRDDLPEQTDESPVPAVNSDTTINADANSHDNMTQFEPTRIMMENGVEWRLAGETYEMIEMNPSSIPPNVASRQLLVNQSDLSSVQYEFSLRYPGQSVPVRVSLNSSQCIVVDNGLHQPYVLLNPAGIAKLDKSFRALDGSSLIQQVQVHMYNEATDTHTHATTETNTSAGTDTATEIQTGTSTAAETHIPTSPTRNDAHIGHARNRPFNTALSMLILRYIGRIRNLDRGFYGTLLKLGLVCFIFRPDQIFLFYWRAVMVLLLLTGSCYLLLVQPTRLDNFVNGLGRDELYRDLIPPRMFRVLRTSIRSLQRLNQGHLVEETKQLVGEYLRTGRYNEIDHLDVSQKGGNKTRFVVKRNFDNIMHFIIMFALSWVSSSWVSEQVQLWWEGDVVRTAVYLQRLNRQFNGLKDLYKEIAPGTDDASIQEMLEYEVPLYMLDVEAAKTHPEFYEEEYVDQDQNHGNHNEPENNEDAPDAGEVEEDLSTETEKHYEQVQVSYQKRLAVYTELKAMVNELGIFIASKQPAI